MDKSLINNEPVVASLYPFCEKTGPNSLAFVDLTAGSQTNMGEFQNLKNSNFLALKTV